MNDFRKYKVGALCAGYGGIELGLSQVLETELVWFSEIDHNASKVLNARFPSVKESNRFGDLKDLRKQNPPEVDIVTAGFPCQPVSVAAEISKDSDGEFTFRKGISDDRWLINDVCSIAKNCKARWVILENVPGLISWQEGKAWKKVYDALKRNGFKRMEWGMYRAQDVGAPHIRRRWFCIATNTPDERLEITNPYQVALAENHMRVKHPYFGFRTYKGPYKAEVMDLPQPQKRKREHDLEKFTLPTPTAREKKDSGPNINFKKISEKSGLTGVIMYRLCTKGGRNKFSGWEGWRKIPHNARGDYSACINRWEEKLGREAPNPLREGKYGLLNHEFVEWMMGLEEGYVTSTDIGLGSGVALGLLGNGVVPQQAAYAITNLGERMNSRLDSVDKKNAGVISQSQEGS